MLEFIIGFVAGAIIAGVLSVVLGRARAADADRQLQAAQQQMRDAFASVAAQALDANSRRLSESAAATLEGKKQLIDQSLATMAERLEQVRQYVQKSEAERKHDTGALSASLGTLSSTTAQLHQLLASTQRRGAWGERMAEDVLRLAGLQERINYVKQSTADAAEGGRADFTFLLPNGLKCNMDVKFPLEKYKSYLDAASGAQRETALKELCAAVRRHIRDVAGRGYIDPHVPTVPYVVVFIPSEQIFSLVLACQSDLIDDALAAKVVLASPLTLYAKLSIMRQAAESYNLMKTADEVIELLGAFSKQWQKYNEELDRLGAQLDTARKTYDGLRTTRTNMLAKPLERIEELRSASAPGDATN
jgi:DNA recombination protein RmuC